MNISIASIKKSQLNASKSASTATMEAPVKKQVKNAKPDYSGVPEAEAEAKAIKAAKKSTATTKARSERKVAQKKAVAPNAEPKAAIKPKAEAKALFILDNGPSYQESDSAYSHKYKHPSSSYVLFIPKSQIETVIALINTIMWEHIKPINAVGEM